MPSSAWSRGSASTPTWALHRAARFTPGVVVYRVDDRLFFANAGYVKGPVREAVRGAPTPTRWIVFDAEAMTHVDAAGLATIRELAQELGGEDTTLAFARVKSPLRRRFDEVGVTEEHFHPTMHAAVGACLSAD